MSVRKVWGQVALVGGAGLFGGACWYFRLVCHGLRCGLLCRDCGCGGCGGFVGELVI